MGEASIDRILKSFGLTDSETEVYIFLAKHGILKCSEISKQMKKDRAQSLRILKSLQSKGLVESTLESPTRYSPVPFELIIDLSIKAKKDEATQIENAKNELLNYWKTIDKTCQAPSPEKFMVIEGKSKIYSKITQMVMSTKSQLSSVCTVEGLIEASRFGLFDSILNRLVKSAVEFRFLTEVLNSNLTALKSLLREPLKTKVNFRGRNPDLGLRLFPRMVIRDNEEIVFFIKPGLQEQSEMTFAFGQIVST